MNPPTAQEASRGFFGEPTERDYPEDFLEDNGQYLHTCVSCKLKFIGHKRRVQCKPCQEQSAAEWDKMPEDAKNQLIAKALVEMHKRKVSDA